MPEPARERTELQRGRISLKIGGQAIAWRPQMSNDQLWHADKMLDSAEDTIDLILICSADLLAGAGKDDATI